MTVATLLDKVICRFLAKLDGVSIVKCILSKLELGFLRMELNSKLNCIWLDREMYLYRCPFQVLVLDNGNIPQSVCILNVVSFGVI